MDFKTKSFINVSNVSNNNYNVQTLFREYDHYELYDSNKEYDKNKFQYDYGNGNKFYNFGLYIIQFEESSEPINYVVAIEEVSDEELQKIAKYCQCTVCTSNWYNLSRYFTCSCCIGCLKSFFPQQYQINDARKYILENKIKID